MMAVQNMFDPRHYERVRLPAMEAEPLPPWCYTSQEFYREEVEQLFMKSWNLIGREDLIPNAGDYMTLSFVGVPLIIIRDAEGTIRAFSNSCRHRGSRLLSGEGNCNAIICPYHSWTYKLSGELAAASGMENAVGFKPSDHALVPIAIASWQGFLFVNFNPGAETLSDHLGDLPDQLGSYNFADMVCTRRKTYNVGCNWKLYAENQNEGYHIRTVHYKSLFAPRYGQSAGHGAAPITRPKTRGNWMTTHLALKGTEGIKRGETTTFPTIQGLKDTAATGTHFAMLYPSTFLACTSDCMWWMECRPHGPEKTEVVVGSCFPKSTVARADFDEQVKKYYARWDESHPEDNEACEFQQQGLASPFSKLGRFSHLEAGVHSIAVWVLDRMLSSRNAANGA